MATSFFDEYLHQIRCPAPKCRKTFKKVLRSLVEPKEVICPHCGVTIDIRESKSTGQIGSDFEMANEVDKQRMEKK